MENRIDEVSEKSHQVNELLSAPPNWILRSGIFMIFSFVVLFLFVSWLIKYPSIVPIEVKISSSYPPVGIYSQSSGKMSLYFKEKDTIKANDIIASIESPGDKENIKSLANLLDTLNIEYLIASPDIWFDNTWELGEIQEQYNLFFETIDNYRASVENKPIFYKKESIRKQVDGMKSLLASQIERKNNYIQELKLATKSYERNNSLYVKEVISLVELETSEKELLRTKRLLKDAQIEIENTELKLIESEQLLNENTIDLVRDKQVLINLIKESHKALKAKLNEWELKYLIISPSDGILFFSDFWNDNQYVQEDKEIAIIVPNRNNIYFGNAQMPIYKSGEVKKGQKVIIKLEAYNYREYGSLIGHVDDISAIHRDDKYKLKIRFPNGLITDYGNQLHLDRELKGKGEIITEKLTLLDRYFYRFKAITKNTLDVNDN